jgi:meso-butanediol dehydrogenase/(S,S)-butanediol dehydrogenase/diacetyl reductase
MHLSERVIVVTGAASGIGAACVERCRAAGATVEELDAASGVDVSDKQAVAEAMNGIAGRHGRIDGLVNCAGIAFRAPVAEHDEERWEALMRVNVGGVFLASKYAIPHMRRGASIVHMSSAVALTGVRNRAGYSATKGAIVALTRNMALDYAPRGIRVNCLCPGFTRTPLIGRLLDTPDGEAKLTALHPLGRLGEPEDIANAVAFLLSDQASWITGVALAVDGGFSAGLNVDI